MIDIFDTRTMLAAIEQMKRPTNWLRDTFFGRVEQFDTTTVDVDIVKGKRRMAPFVHPLAEGKQVEGLGFQTKTIKPGYIKPKMVTTAGDLLKRAAGETIYAGSKTPQQRAMEKLGKDLMDLMDQIDRREEWMAAKALDGGAITMKIKGDTADQTAVVDFGMSGTHKVTLGSGARWNEANVNPIFDLASWVSLNRKDSGHQSSIAVLGIDAAVALLKNAEVQNLLDLKNVELGRIDPALLPNGVSYLGTLRAPGMQIDLYTYEEWYIDEDSGVETPMVPAKKVWVGSPRTRNARLYAAIQDVEAIEGGQAAVDRFPKSWVVKDPGARLLMVQSAPLVAMLEPDAFVSAQVLS